jgi:hypothetical protein
MGSGRPAGKPGSRAPHRRGYTESTHTGASRVPDATGGVSVYRRTVWTGLQQCRPDDGAQRKKIAAASFHGSNSRFCIRAMKCWSTTKKRQSQQAPFTRSRPRSIPVAYLAAEAAADAALMVHRQPRLNVDSRGGTV